MGWARLSYFVWCFAADWTDDAAVHMVLRRRPEYEDRSKAVTIFDGDRDRSIDVSS